MNQKEKEDLKRTGELLDSAVELAGEAVMILGINGRMAEVGQAEAAMFEFGNIPRKIDCILDEVADDSTRVKQ